MSHPFDDFQKLMQGVQGFSDQLISSFLDLKNPKLEKMFKNISSNVEIEARIGTKNSHNMITVNEKLFFHTLTSLKNSKLFDVKRTVKADEKYPEYTKTIEDGSKDVYQKKTLIDKYQNKVWEFKISSAKEEELKTPKNSLSPTLKRVKTRYAFVDKDKNSIFSGVEIDLTIVKNFEGKTEKPTTYEIEMEVTDRSMSYTDFIYKFFVLYAIYSQLNIYHFTLDKDFVKKSPKDFEKLFSFFINSGKKSELFLQANTLAGNKAESNKLNFRRNEPRNIKRKDDTSDSLVSCKLDGKRKFIWVSEDGIYAINIPFEIVKIISLKDKSFSGSLFDAEMMEDGKVFIFDTLYFKNKNVQNHSFTDRLAHTKEFVASLENSNFVSKKFYQANSKGVSSAFKDCESFSKNYNSDGLIFQPNNKQYLNSETLKWKPVENMTIDFIAVRSSTDNIFNLYSWDVTNKRKELFEKQAYIKNGIFQKEDPNNRTLEFRWDAKKEYFVPEKYRDDKVIPNKTSVALDDWEDINNPITKDEIINWEDNEIVDTTKKVVKNIPKKPTENPNFHMRKFHNSLKEKILQSYTEPNNFLIDIGSGHGGDVDKWKNLNLGKILAIEPDQDHIKVLKQRIEKANISNIKVLKAVAEDTKDIVSAITSLSGGEEKADVIVAFFSLTYIFESEDNLNRFVETIQQTLKNGGKFLAIVLDGEKVKELLGDKKKVSNSSFSIKKGEWENSKYGNVIYTDVKGSVTADNVKEYLFDYKTFVKKLKEISLEPIFTEFIKDEPSSLSEDNLLFSRMNRVMVFEKSVSNKSIFKGKDLDERIIEVLAIGKQENIEINEQAFTRIGTIADNSSIIHAIVQAFSKKYKNLEDFTEKIKYVENARSKFSHNLNMKKFLELASGSFSAELINNYRKIGEQQPAEVALAKFKKLILEDYLGDNFEILQYIGDLLKINIFTVNMRGSYMPSPEISDAPIYDAEGNIQYKNISRKMKCDFLYKKDRKSIILFNVDDISFETLSVDDQTLFDFDDKVIKKLYNNVCYDEPLKPKKPLKTVNFKEYDEKQEKEALKVKKGKKQDDFKDYENYTIKQLVELLEKRGLDSSTSTRYELVKRLQVADRKPVYSIMTKNDLLKLLIKRRLQVNGVDAKDIKKEDITDKKDFVKVLLEDDMKNDMNQFEIDIKKVSKKKALEKVPSPKKTLQKKSPKIKVKDFVSNKLINLPFSKYETLPVDELKEDLYNLFIEKNIDFPFKKYFEKSPRELFENLKEYKGLIIEDNKGHENLIKSYGFKTNLLKNKEIFRFNFDQKADYETITIETQEDEYHNIDVFTDVLGQEENRLKVFKNTSKGIQQSAWDYFYDKETFKVLINGLIKNKKDINMENLREELFSKNLEATQFKPSLAKSVYDIFRDAYDVLDISAGWGDRMAGAVASGVNSYVGYDPNTKLKETHDKIRKFADDPKNFKVIYEPFENAKLEKSFDLVFSSPPFFDYEVYSVEGQQSILNYPTFEGWLVNFLFKSMKNAWEHLTGGGSLVLHITDISKDKKIIEPMILFALTQLKRCKFDGIITSLAGAGKHRPMWVFKKVPLGEEIFSKDEINVLIKDFEKYYKDIWDNLNSYNPSKSSSISSTKSSSIVSSGSSQKKSSSISSEKKSSKSLSFKNNSMKNFKYFENSCFMDSVLFMLLSSDHPVIKEMLTHNEFNKALGTKCKVVDRKKLQKELLKMYENIRSPSNSQNSPSNSQSSSSNSQNSLMCIDFRKLLKLCKIDQFEDFSSGEMRDADEFLKYLFRVLEYEKNTLRILTFGTNDLKTKYIPIKDMQKTNIATIEDASPINSYELIQDKEKISLYHLINAPKDSGKLDEGYTYTDDNGNEKTFKRRYEFNYTLEKNNKINIYHINRTFLNDEEEEEFNSKNIVIPDEELKGEDNVMELSGVVCWEDDHYTSYSLVNGHSNRWVYSDDTFEDLVDIGVYEDLIHQRLVMHNAVMFMYTSNIFDTSINNN